jgi:hypothetical protein
MEHVEATLAALGLRLIVDVVAQRNFRTESNQSSQAAGSDRRVDRGLKMRAVTRAEESMGRFPIKDTTSEGINGYWPNIS